MTFTLTLRDPERCEVGETELVRAGTDVVRVVDGKRTLQILQPGASVLFAVTQLDCTEASFKYWSWPDRARPLLLREVTT